MSKKQRQPRLNSMRLLDANRVAYETSLFSPDIHSATDAADAMGMDPDMVYKTLVVLRPAGRPLLVMIAGSRELNPKTLATSIGEKKVHMATQREAESLTGLQVGGISALALLNKGFDVYIDRPAEKLERVAVSAGQRGVNLRLAVADLVRVTGARWVDATGESDSRGGHVGPPS
jgi:Cys-tRNA(Pro)/Cys-tRNA(Cys) deacylase